MGAHKCSVCLYNDDDSNNNNNNNNNHDDAKRVKNKKNRVGWEHTSAVFAFTDRRTLTPIKSNDGDEEEEEEEEEEDDEDDEELED